MNAPIKTPAGPRESHLIGRTGWLRAAVLGANDGIVSTASLIVGVAASGSDRPAVLLAGAAGLVAGAMSMAAGEYVSVSSQSDTERADRAKEVAELAADPEGEERELAMIYAGRGLSPDVAAEVARQLTEHDALGAHLRDELGIGHLGDARPVQAAGASAVSFAVGAGVPVLIAALAPLTSLIWSIPLVALALLATLGMLGARAGGAPLGTAGLRVAFWGAAAMALTALVGHLVGTGV